LSLVTEKATREAQGLTDNGKRDMTQQEGKDHEEKVLFDRTCFGRTADDEPGQCSDNKQAFYLWIAPGRALQ
jgi:hypothetical protein